MFEYCTRLLFATTLFLVIVALTACSSAAPPLPTNTPAPTDTPAPPTATPEPTALPEVTTVTDLPYATAVDPQAEDQALDIYYLPGTGDPKPVVIWAHGLGGGKASEGMLARPLAERGLVIMALDWKDEAIAESDVGFMREAMENALCALRFATENGAEYGADPDRVIWAGFSAGAWLGSLISFAEGDLQGDWDANAEANEGPEQRVECVAQAEPAQITNFVGNSGLYLPSFWYGDPPQEEWDASFTPLQTNSTIGNNPNLRVRIIHGEQDVGWPTTFEAAERFAGTLEEAGYDVEFLPESGGHRPFDETLIELIPTLAE